MVLGTVIKVHGKLSGCGSVNQVEVTINEGKKKGMTIIRNVFGPIKVGEVIELVDTTKEERLRLKNRK